MLRTPLSFPQHHFNTRNAGGSGSEREQAIRERIGPSKGERFIVTVIWQCQLRAGATQIPPSTRQAVCAAAEVRAVVKISCRKWSAISSGHDVTCNFRY